MSSTQLSKAETIQMPTLRDWVRHYGTTLGVLAATMVVYGSTMVLIGGFATLPHLLYTMQLAAFLGVAAVGEFIVILTGGIDLSTANVISATAILLSTLFALTTLPMPLIIVIGLLVAAAIGAINGIGVALFKIPPLVMTLAVGGIVQGVQLVATSGSPRSGTSPILAAIVNKNLWNGLTGTVLVWLFIIIAIALFLHTTRWGRYLYAIGTNVKVAQLSGVPVVKVTILAYILSGLMAGLAGCLLLGYTGIAISTMGDAYLLPAIAAVVLGGASILGGRGGSLGTALGAFLFTVVIGLLRVLQLEEADRQILQGAILLIVVIVYNLRAVKR